MAKTTAEKIKVMQAFERGEQIQRRSFGCDSWADISSPAWDWFNQEYRVKPKIRKIKVYWAILMKKDQTLITTNPKSKKEHDLNLIGYKNTAIVVKQYSDTLEILDDSLTHEIDYASN